MPKSTVAVIRATPETVLEDVSRAMILAGARKRLLSAERLLLKLQLDWDQPVPGVNTQPWQLEGALRFVRSEGIASDRLLAVDHRKPHCRPERALRTADLAPILQQHAVSFRSLADVAWTHQSLPGPFRILPRLFAQHPPLPEALEGRDVLLLPTLKTHAALSVGASVASLFSLLLPRVPLLTSHEQHELAVDLLSVLRQRGARCFTLIDATVCGDGAGPRTVRPSLQNALIASADPVAADAVAASLMGRDPWSIPYLRWATEAHLGQARVGEIQVVGEDITAVEFGLRETKSPAHWGELPEASAWSRNFHRIMARVPLGRMYQDAIWMPLVGSRLRRHYGRTPWGRLAAHYRRGPVAS